MPRAAATTLKLTASFLVATGSGAAIAQASSVTASPVVVTATRAERSGFDLPVSIDSVGRERLQEGQLQVNLSEALGRVPGLVVQNRQNYAQDLQISSRGFGARASFGVRGLRIYSDGIPATMPDGQGQVSHIDIGSAARIEVMRGPFSALYGNSSGGVIAAFSEDGMPGLRVEPSYSFGSYGTSRIAVKMSGESGPLNYLASIASFRTGGYRDHSSARRESGNAKLRWTPDTDTRVTLVMNAMNMPNIQDPLGLDRASFEADPRQATAVAHQFNTRKSASQQQLGLTLERKVGVGDTVSLSTYRGHRETTQFQSIPTGAQAAATHPGGVIDLGRDYWGLDARWSRRSETAAGRLTLTAGFTYDLLDEARRGYQNFVGTQTGVLGALRRDENNRIHNFDQYLQAEWEPTAQWLMMAGIRHSVVKVTSKDRYIVGTNPDDSGSVDYGATTPVAGITWRATPAINVYASAGRGFETPTMNELSYRAGGSGPNFALQAATSDNLELGVKALVGDVAQVNAAVFGIRTKNEIVTLQNSGGRTVFQNVGSTRRDGFELAAEGELGRGLSYGVSFTRLRAVYAEDFRSCTGAPCAAPNTPIAAGKRIPGIPASTLAWSLAWKHPASGFTGEFEVRSASKVYVNDTNSDAAPAYSVANLRFGFQQSSVGWTFKEFLRIDNVGDRKYAGSVIVNDGNSRFFEPAPGRSFLLGVSVNHGF